MLLRDERDDRTVAKFVSDECGFGNWQLRFYVTTIKDVKADPDAEPDERFTYEGAAREFEREMRMRDDEIAAVLDEPIMQIADNIRCDYKAQTMEIEILY